MNRFVGHLNAAMAVLCVCISLDAAWAPVSIPWALLGYQHAWRAIEHWGRSYGQ